MNTEKRERLAAAEAERHNLLIQAASQHVDNVETEARRYKRELVDIERVYRMRTGQEIWTMQQLKPDFVRLASTAEDRAERMAFVHRATRPGKSHRQTRSNDRRKAITESREAVWFLRPDE
jgi:hypothetical protein